MSLGLSIRNAYAFVNNRERECDERDHGLQPFVTATVKIVRAQKKTRLQNEELIT